MTWKANGVEYETKKEGLIQESKDILSSYFESITLRQLYYRLVAQDLIDNKQSNYQYLSKAIKEARLRGTISFSDIEDRTRSSSGGDTSYIKPKERLKAAYDNFKEVVDRQKKPKWEGQDYYIEVWVEKEALASIFESVGKRKNVTIFPCRGYTGWTSLNNAYERMNNIDREKKILYFGDFDPSGKDIERFIRESLKKEFGLVVDVERYALTRDQIDKYQLPPQPAKSSDSRYEDFVEEHGDIAVELDALDPDILKDLISEAVDKFYDEEYYEENIKPKEEEEKEWMKEQIEEMAELVDKNFEWFDKEGG